MSYTPSVISENSATTEALTVAEEGPLDRSLYFQIRTFVKSPLGGDEYITSLAFWNVPKWPLPHPAKQADFWRGCAA